MVIENFMTGLAGFLGTYLIHSSVLLLAALGVHRLLSVGTATKEALYRTAMIAPVLTAALAVNPAFEPLAGTIEWIEVGEEVVHEIRPDVADTAPTTAGRTASVPVAEGDAAVMAPPAPEPEAPAPAVQPRVPEAHEGIEGPGATMSGAYPRPVLSFIAGAWLLVAFLTTARWLNGARAGRRLLDGRQPLAAGRAHEALLRLTARAGTPAPALSVCDALGGPATLPSGEICIPGWALDLPASQLEAMLAHELAHVERRDPWWLAVAVALEALFWLQPLNRAARHRLAGLAELHADGRAARLTGDGRALAHCLASCAERMSAGRMPVLAAAMARRGGFLSERVGKLVTDSTETGGISMSRKFMIFAGVMALVMVLPSVTVLANKSGETRGTSIEIRETDDGARSMSLSFTDDEMRMKLRASGNVVFAPDGSGIDTLGPGSELEVMQEEQGVKRRLQAEGTVDGIQYTYHENGEEQPYDDEAQAWFADIMPMVLRETAINAPERVDYLMEQGGHAAVLEEIGKIRSDFARRNYIEAYAVTGELPEGSYDRLVEEAAKLGSDFEMRNALSVIYDTQEPRGEKLADLIVVADAIGSDFELRQLLGILARDAIGDESVMAAYAKAAEGIGSDFELRQALEALMEAGGGPRAVIIALPVAGEISSDFEMRSLLEEAASEAAQDAEASRVWLKAAATIGSDFELRQALGEFANQAPSSVSTWQALFETAEAIGSDHECSSFLLEAAEHMPDNPEVEEAFRSVMETIGSDSDYRRVAKVLER